jgi:type II secretory pathway component GspD/PulD (secretin)
VLTAREALTRLREGNERFTLNFRNIPIEQVFELLSRKEQVNIIVTKGVGGTVSVNLYNVTVKEAIQSVAGNNVYWNAATGTYVGANGVAGVASAVRRVDRRVAHGHQRVLQPAR